MLAKKRILVTGGSGFIGSALIWALNRRGLQNILVADLLRQDEKWKNLVPLRFVDYLEADDLLRLVHENSTRLADIGYIFHLGACSATTERDASYLVRNNFEYTKALADWALGKGARFVYASSAATYGDGLKGMSDSADLTTLRPLNMYGYSKHLFDLYAQRQGVLEQIVGVKYFNVFGPNENHKGDMRSLVHKAYGQVVNEGAIKLFASDRPDYANGEQKRDFLYVKDAVEMTIHLAEAPRAGGLFNLGSGEANSWNTLAKAIFSALGREPRIEYIPMPDILRAKYQYFTQAEIGKLRETGYDRAVTPLADAVADYVMNYLVPQSYLGDEA
ncbi:MAG TPA: ADP-glyceromanno-heptose 6-epimerase [Chthoniobacteraceae bacterium]|nr:ADP-glyceromanno-heptose 6-epimerase [Chthoniobacteraceae bacterium]